MLGLAAVLLGAVACDETEGGTGTPAATSTVRSTEAAVPTATTPATETSPDAATVAPQGEEDILDCGSEEQVHGEGRNIEARQCLADAYAQGRAAAFHSAMVTIEGDPVPWDVYLDAAGGIEAVFDATEDRFSSPEDRRVHTFRCSGLTLTDVDQPATIELTGCDGDSGGSIAI